MICLPVKTKTFPVFPDIIFPPSAPNFACENIHLVLEYMDHTKAIKIPHANQKFFLIGISFMVSKNGTFIFYCPRYPLGKAGYLR